MYSFYGGRPGNSFVIITTYRSINDMVDNFKKGPVYTAVHYDEHVMINTENKNDPDNGKIYRRGYDFTNDMGGAEFIGTIVGPSGPAPMLELTSLQEIENKKAAAEQWEETRYGSDSYSINNSGLVPGKFVDSSEQPQYNDEIKWSYCSIRSANGEDCTAYIGFTIPYTVIDFTSTPISPYINGQYKDNTSVTRVDDGKHPFYEKWNINIPKGINGSLIKNLKVEKVTNDNKGTFDPYTGIDDDAINGREILTYEYYDYSTKQDGDRKKVYFGDYNMIDDVEMDEKGTIKINYTHNDPTYFTNALRTITSVLLNEDTGEFRVDYNQPINEDGKEYYTTSLRWVKDIDINSENGNITFYYPNNESRVIDAKLKWITSTVMDANGIITIIYNDGSQVPLGTHLKWINSVNIQSDGTVVFGWNNSDDEPIIPSQKIKWIDSIYFDPSGTVSIKYNTDPQPVDFPNLIKWIDAVSLDPNNGDFTIRYNDNNTVNLGSIRWINSIDVDDQGNISVQYNNVNTPTVLDTKVRWPNDFRIDPTTQRLVLDWNTGSSLNISDPINYILDMGINAEGHLLVKYSDPNRQDTSIRFNGTTGWADLGSALLSDIQYSGNTVTNLNWTGMGMLQNTNIQSEAEKIIKFTIVPTQLLRHTLNNVTINSGTITVIRRGENEAITGFNSADLTQKGANVTKTFAGIDFEIPSGIASDSSAAPVFVDIIITDLSLTFS